MFCHKCGKELEDGNKFCRYCGAETAIVQEKTELIQGDHSGTKKKLYIGIGAAVCFVAIIIFVAALLIGKKNSDSGEKEVQKNPSPTELEKEAAAPAATLTPRATLTSAATPSPSPSPTPTLSPTPSPTPTLTPTPTPVPLPGEVVSLLSEVENLNASGTTIQGILVYERNYNPAQRSTEAVWDRSVMYALEDLAGVKKDGYLSINECDIEKKEFINAETGNVIDYEIYRNSVSGKIHKIVSIEYMGDHLELTDYYYTTEGKISFIFQRNSDTYQPTYATPDKEGNRYFYSKDRMVAWRKVVDGKSANYVVGEKELKRQKNEGRTNITLFSNLSEKGKKRYDEREINMLNAAYNTLHAVENSEGINVVQGFVYDIGGQAFSGADVKLYLSKENGFAEDYLVYEMTTDAQGTYGMRLPVIPYRYYIVFSYDGCTETILHNVDISNQNIGVYQPAVHLMQDDNNTYEVRLHLGDALNYADGSHTSMAAIRNAEVSFRTGLNNYNGEVLDTVYSDQNGDLRTHLRLGMYTAQIDQDGYEVLYYNIISDGSGNQTVINVLPELMENELAIVLTWGSSPNDLDSHLFDPNDNNGHIWYGAPWNNYGASLDVDVTRGYGPETVTISNLTNGLYKYYVADFSNCSAGNLRSTQMSYSDATVNVYSSSGLLQSFHVPTNQAGVIWEVFEIRNRRIVPIQRYYSNIQDKSWWHSSK